MAHGNSHCFTAFFTVMCYNVLCDKYCTRQLYGYCPSWALNWEYRKKGILEEIKNYSADIISLQVRWQELPPLYVSVDCTLVNDVYMKY